MFAGRSRRFGPELPACNNWVDIRLPEVYDDPDLASFNGAHHADVRTDRPTWSSRRLGYSPATTPQTGRRFTALSTEPWAARANHRDPPGRGFDAGVVVRRWAVDRHRRAWTKQEGRRRSTMLCSNQAARKRIAEAKVPQSATRPAVLGQCMKLYEKADKTRCA